MAKRQEPLKVSGKTRVIEIPRVKGKSYPRTTTPHQASVEQVTRMADFLVEVGFEREFALLTIAAQLHESLVAIKRFDDARRKQ